MSAERESASLFTIATALIMVGGMAAGFGILFGLLAIFSGQWPAMIGPAGIALVGTALLLLGNKCLSESFEVDKRAQAERHKQERERRAKSP